jgi:hypothetical protein
MLPGLHIKRKITLNTKTQTIFKEQWCHEMNNLFEGLKNQISTFCIKVDGFKIKIPHLYCLEKCLLKVLSSEKYQKLGSFRHSIGRHNRERRGGFLDKSDP